MRTHKFVVDPATGKMRTEEGPDTSIVEYKLAEARRQCRDVIQGNVPFHVEKAQQPLDLTEANLEAMLRDAMTVGVGWGRWRLDGVEWEFQNEPALAAYAPLQSSAEFFGFDSEPDFYDEMGVVRSPDDE